MAGPLDVDSEPWSDIAGEEGLVGCTTCPESASTLWANKSVYIQVKKDGTGLPIFGCLSLRMEEDENDSSAWLVWEPDGDELIPASRSYAMSVRVSHVHSIRFHRPNIGTPQALINLRNGCTQPPLFFHAGGVMEFKSTLADVAALTRSEACAATVLVNDATDMLQRSLHQLDLSTSSSPAATRSRAATKPSSPQQQGASTVSGASTSFGAVTSGKRAAGSVIDTSWSGPGESGEWQWRALQGGATVMRGIRDGWSKASAVARDAASTAADILQESDSPSPPHSPGRAAGSDCTRDEGNDAAALAAALEEEGCVLVEHEAEPWQTQHPVGVDEWRSWFDTSGRLKSYDKLRNRAYYGGLSPSVRREAWKFLLGCYPSDSTRREREALAAAKSREYEAYRAQWQSITPAQEARFAKFRDRRHRIEKDVVRTDRTHPLFANEDSEALKRLHRILLSYSFYNFDLAYCQGMSDLAAPLLVVMEDEVEAFWAFQALMDMMEPNFHKDQNGMHTQLQTLRCLCQELEPGLLAFLEERDCSNLYFCFRWLLIAFKREFALPDLLRLWEALWSRWRGPNLHLVMAAAILRQHHETIVAEDMGFDSVLKFVNNLSGQMDLLETLKAADVLAQEASRIPPVQAALHAIPPSPKAKC